MEPINLKGFVFLTTTYSGRLPLLIATIGSTMNSVTNAEFVVRWYEDDMTGYTYMQHILGMVAKATGNTLTTNLLPATMSVAHSKKNIGNVTDLQWFVNLDDDLIIPYRALQRMAEARMPTRQEIWPTSVITIGVQDGDNTRGFADYDETKYEDFEAFLRLHPPGKAKHHMFAKEVTIAGYRWISQLYAMHWSVYNSTDVWAPILERFTTKGVRGYDICLENRLTELGINTTLISGHEAMHLGLEHAYIGGPWKAADVIARTVVETHDGYNTTE